MGDLMKRLEAAAAQDEKACITAALEYAGHHRLISREATRRGWDLASVGAWLELALLLVPEGWVYSIADRGDDGGLAILARDILGHGISAKAKTVPLALCIAALRAHEALQPAS